jgi:arsenical pump membrane protein
LSNSGKITAAGIAVMAVTLMLSPGSGLGLATFTASAATWGVVSCVDRVWPWRIARQPSWGVVPLVAGLFVLVEALDRSGATAALSSVLRHYALCSTRRRAGVDRVMEPDFPGGLPNGKPITVAPEQLELQFEAPVVEPPIIIP